jgi:hypothetical protein
VSLVDQGAPAHMTIPARPTPVLRPTAPTNGATPAGNLSLRAGERKMLMVLAQRYPMRFTRTQLGTLAGYTASGGTFGAYYGALKRHGLIQESGGEVQITRAGLDYLGTSVPPQPQTSEELRSMWQGVLRGGKRKMLDELIAVYPGALTREELGERAGYTASGGTFGANLGTLRRNGLVEVDGGEVRASEVLFLINATML